MAHSPSHIDVWSDRALAVACLGRISPHRHAAAALLVGLDDTFRIGRGTSWRRTRAAFVPAGVEHALDCGSGRMAVHYLFPFTGAAERFAARWGVTLDRVRIDLPVPSDVRDALGDIHGGVWTQTAVRRWMDDALFGGGEPTVLIDPRLARAAALVRSEAVAGVAAETVANTAGLSPSRLMRLFQAQGVTLRRYRQWERMRLLTERVASGDSLTRAGLAAGFADSAHLSHSFRAMFGAPPSRLLLGGSRLRVAP